MRITCNALLSWLNLKVYIQPCTFNMASTQCVLTGIVQIGGESVCPVDASGNFTQEITDFAGQ